MSDRKQRICSVCKKTYLFCPHCNEDRDKPNWMMAFCSENCKSIYEIASQFENEQLNKNTAYEKLQSLDLSELDNFGESYKNAIKKIKAYKPAKVTAEDSNKTVKIQKPKEKKADNIE